MQVPPQHDGPAPGPEAVQQRCVGGAGALQKPPLLGPLDQVEVPDPGGALAVRRCAGDDELACLGEGGRLQPHAEPAEILRGACGAGPRAAMVIAVTSSGFGHPVAVVDDRDPRVPPVPGEDHIDLPGLGGDAVVDQIGDGGLEAVTQRPERLDRPRRMRVGDLVVHAWPTPS